MDVGGHAARSFSYRARVVGSTGPAARRIVVLLAVLAVLLMLVAPTPAGAEGTEELGPPDIPVASGTGMAVAGTGLFDQPGTIEVEVPQGATVRQVLLYWEGQHTTSQGDDTLTVDGTAVTGTLIGGPTQFFHDVNSSSYRADITDLGLVEPGTSRLSVAGGEFDEHSNGAGVLVIYDDGGTDADIWIRDGSDLAFHRFAPPLDTTEPQTFEFEPAPVERTARLGLFASSVGSDRPTAIDVTVDGETERFCDRFGDTDGPEWSTVRLPVTIPAGAEELTVQARSLECEDSELTGQPGSIHWSASALLVPPPSPGASGLGLDLVKTNDADGDGTFSDSEGAPEERAAVPFDVSVTNAGQAPVVVDELTDAFGDVEVDLLAGSVSGGEQALVDNGCATLDGVTLAAGQSETCRFTLEGYAPPGGESLVDTVTVTGHDADAPERTASASDDSTVATPGVAVLGSRVQIELVKTNDADGDGTFSDTETAPEAGADVPFRVVVRNPGTVPVVLEELTDAFGDVEVDLLAGSVSGGEQALVDNGCATLDGVTLAAGQSETCRFTLEGYAPPAGESLVDTVTVSGHERGATGQPATASDDSTVRAPGGARLPATGIPAGWLAVLAAVLLAGGATLLRRTGGIRPGDAT